MRINSIIILILTGLIASSFAQKGGVWTDPKEAAKEIDYQIQGEYKGDNTGVQVIGLSNGRFSAVVYPGGLPGDGWDKKNKIILLGKLEGSQAVFSSPADKLSYVNKDPDKFSPVKSFPPPGQKKYSGKADGKTLTLKTDSGSELSLKKEMRVSPTIGMKPPAGAVVLFDGSNSSSFNGGRLDEVTKLLNTDGKDIRTKEKFSNYKIHVEFMLPYRPAARGQGRGNSGFYQVDHYELQILDSFGLDGWDNECGGVYKKARPILNMCLPPLQWQTYDVEFTNAVSENGKKVKNAFLTVRLNGVLVQDNLEINGKTGGSRGEAEGTPGPLKFQGHGNPLQYRNIWIIKK